jgi:hypothetical protein
MGIHKSWHTDIIMLLHSDYILWWLTDLQQYCHNWPSIHVTTGTTCFEVQNPKIFPTHNIYMFHVSLKTNNDFPNSTNQVVFVKAMKCVFCTGCTELNVNMLWRRPKFLEDHTAMEHEWMYVCMYVRTYVYEVGHEIQPLHRDLQWYIVLPLLINPLLILQFEWNVDFIYGGIIIVTWFHKELVQVTIS